MLTIFLVEDEKIELDLLRNHIDWESMNFRVAGAAKNGRKAWEQIRELKPDVVLTDVRMPIMDGLQLASLIRTNFEWMKIIFLSGHDEFTYVKTALQAGAIGYLLKPIDRLELSAVIAKVKEEVEKEHLLRTSKHVLIEKRIEELYISADSGNREQAWQELVRIAPEVRHECFVTALIRADNDHIKNIPRLIREQLLAHELEGTVIKLDEQEWLLAVKYTAETDFEPVWHAVRQDCGLSVTIGVADKAAALDQAYAMLIEARKAAGERFYLGLGRIIHANRVQAERMDAAYPLEDVALPGDLDLFDLSSSSFISSVEHYFDSLIRMRVRREKAYEAAINLLKKMDNACAKIEDQARKELGELHDWNRAIVRQDTLPGIKAFILELADRISRYMADRQQDRHMLLVREVAELIDKAYFEPLTIEQLAAKVYISPNYLRALFKEKQGCTIHEYLTKVRLANALELLRDRTLKIHDVAKRVGYDNTSYFCSFFYKTQGVTPNEYRKKFL
ncbi:response regulator [Paenibacillus sp. LHD-117]|uniref:response regulator n=1 Tax=Paenibacillus sp. LHD-117 TaxID=3071412 RepID=UPI0027E20CD9|nr:response regulator [Paenibacillus sp. LHD-117]MDQ6418406.1 response regulator [Paenibacillus sp. LHD-117]